MTQDISIITVAYNSANTIADALRSVAEQDYCPIEHIIIDGASRDNTLDIVAGYDHITECISEKDDGLYDAMNKGIRRARGSVVGILNSDDYYTSQDVISRVMKKFGETGADGVYTNLHYVRDNDSRTIVRKWRAGAYHRSAFLQGWMPPHPGVFFRREVYEKYGLMRLDMGSAADYEFLLRVLYKEKITMAYLDIFSVNMRIGGVSNASMTNRIQANRNDRKAWQVNGLRPYWYTLYLKPLRKITQWI